MYDLIIIGSGPAGLSAALSAARGRLSYLVLERGVIANTVFDYPIARPLFSTSNEVELELLGLSRDHKPTREEVLRHYVDVVVRERINIHTAEEVRSVTPASDGFSVATSVAEYRSRAVLIAVGGFGRPRVLGAAGETTSRVSYRFIEGHPYALKNVLVVGGGNSAAEAALSLAEAGACTTLSLRRPSLDCDADYDRVGLPAKVMSAKIKPWVREPLEQFASEGHVRIITSSRVSEIRHHSAILEVERGGAVDRIEVDCDHIFALIGADPDTSLLEHAGAEIAADGRPIYDSGTYETTVRGLYVAGHLTRELHMKNAIDVGRKVVEGLSEKVLAQSALCEA